MPNTGSKTVKIAIPEFICWKEEAEFWDSTDKAPLMEEKEGKWVGLDHIKPALGLCWRCGARMKRHHLDIVIAYGRITLREVEFYVCPRCGVRTLSPDKQEFVAWSAE